MLCNREESDEIIFSESGRLGIVVIKQGECIGIGDAKLSLGLAPYE
jgi:hypothetical protein